MNKKDLLDDFKEHLIDVRNMNGITNVIDVHESLIMLIEILQEDDQ